MYNIFVQDKHALFENSLIGRNHILLHLLKQDFIQVLQVVLSRFFPAGFAGGTETGS